MNYTKDNLVSVYSKLTGTPTDESKRQFEASLYTIRTVLEQMAVGDHIELRDFMTFRMEEKKARATPGLVSVKHTTRGRRLKITPHRALKSAFQKYIEPTKTAGDSPGTVC